MSLVAEAIERSAAPALVGIALERIEESHPGLADRLADDGPLLDALVAVTASSRLLTRVLATDPLALDALVDLDRRPALEAADADQLASWKNRELMRIAARDLVGKDRFEAVGEALAAMADDVFQSAWELAAADGGPLAVIGMGKLGGRELNYASDVDVVFVGEADARGLMDVARACFRVDADLRPEGRDGPLVRTLASYRAYWDRWAQTWEFQALLKARFVAGHPDLGTGFVDAAGERVWTRPFGAEELREVRAMKARAEPPPA